MPFTLLHFSDSHLYHDKAALLKGICPHDSFSAVLDHAKQYGEQTDAIILGGDMAQDEQGETYARLAAMLPDWQAPVMISPGNHACLEQVQRKLVPGLQQRMGYADHLTGDRWQLITLNTHQPGQVPGLLSDQELERLKRLLSASTERHTLIALHHHPVAIDSLWLDQISLQNSQALWSIINRHQHVRALLCGHIHQAFDCIHQGVRVMGTPSTCVQFAPKEDTFTLDARSPGYRWLQLMDDGSITTVVHRIDGFIPPDLNNTDPY